MLHSFPGGFVALLGTAGALCFAIALPTLDTTHALAPCLCALFVKQANLGCTGPAFYNLIPRAKPVEFLWKPLSYLD